MFPAARKKSQAQLFVIFLEATSSCYHPLIFKFFFFQQSRGNLAICMKDLTVHKVLKVVMFRTKYWNAENISRSYKLNEDPNEKMYARINTFCFSFSPCDIPVTLPLTQTWKGTFRSTWFFIFLQTVLGFVTTIFKCPIFSRCILYFCSLSVKIYTSPFKHLCLVGFKSRLFCRIFFDIKRLQTYVCDTSSLLKRNVNVKTCSISNAL